MDILIVDDEADIRELISDILTDEGYKTRTARNSVTAFEAIAERLPEAIILDIWLKDSELDGLGILETVKRKYPHVPVVIISGHGNIETAINSLRIGAYDYIEKPFKQDRLLHTLKRAIESARLKSENSELKLRTSTPDLMIGNSSAVVQLRQSIDRVAPTGSRIFISGPSGSGKEMIARVVHNKSHRKSAPFVSFNASCLPEDTHAEELFGIEDKNDINAPPGKVGLLEMANGGTLFIDEITDLSLQLQSQFIHFLQDKKFSHVDGDKIIESDVRIIASSRRDIKLEIKAGRLREDLFHRLNVVSLDAPPLKNRRDDIPLLSDYFIKHAANTLKLPTKTLSADAIFALQSYEWPGNIRQLRNVIEWLLIMYPCHDFNDISANMLPKDLLPDSQNNMINDVGADVMSMKLRNAREIFEKQYLMAQIDRFGGNVSRTATFVGMERSALHRKLKSLNVGIDEPASA